MKPMSLLIVVVLVAAAAGGYYWYQEEQKGPLTRAGESLDGTIDGLRQDLDSIGD